MWDFAVSSNELDALLGTSGSNATVVVTAVPGTARAPAQNTPKGFDMYTPDYMGASGASQVCLKPLLQWHCPLHAPGSSDHCRIWQWATCQHPWMIHRRKSAKQGGDIMSRACDSFEKGL